jgi:hypothetical protein
MDNILYDALSSYYHALEQKGYMANSHAQRLMLLIFYRDFTLKDYRGLLSKDDYHLIEKALDCLWGSSCLIPYPDYLKMSKLCLGGVTELVARTKAVEDFNSNIDERMSANEELASTNSSRLDAHDLHLNAIDSHIGTIDSHLGTVDERLANHDTTLEDHGNRISAIERTKVIKEKDYITSIPDINLNA